MTLAAQIERHYDWLAANASRWVEGGTCSPGMLSDQIIKTLSLKLDCEKVNKAQSDEGLLQRLHGALVGEVAALQDFDTGVDSDG